MHDGMIRGMKGLAWDRLAGALALACLQAAPAAWGTVNMHGMALRTSIVLPSAHPVATFSGLSLKLWSLRTPLLQVAEKVAAVLEYACHNAVEPFLEPVLELSHTIVQRDVAEIEAGGRSGGALTSVFLDQVRALAAAAA